MEEWERLFRKSRVTVRAEELRFYRNDLSNLLLCRLGPADKPSFA